jgi:hypothetical protein
VAAKDSEESYAIPSMSFLQRRTFLLWFYDDKFLPGKEMHTNSAIKQPDEGERKESRKRQAAKSFRR